MSRQQSGSKSRPSVNVLTRQGNSFIAMVIKKIISILTEFM